MRLVLTLLIMLAAAPLHGQPVPAPDFALKSLAGANLRLSEYRGQVVVLAFWSSTCRECRELLEILQRLDAEIAGEEALIMAVAVDDAKWRVEQMLTARPGYAILLDVKQDVVKRYEIDKIPSVLVIDRDGMIVDTMTGAAVISTDYGAALRAVLK